MKQGIRPQEYYFHCMAGREGLVDTAVKTSRSGKYTKFVTDYKFYLFIIRDHLMNFWIKIKMNNFFFFFFIFKFI